MRADAETIERMAAQADDCVKQLKGTLNDHSIMSEARPNDRRS